MSTTIFELLDNLRATALDERDKGDKFERLIKAYLENDPEWAQKFTDVWLWSDWPGRKGRPDTGVDLVAVNRDDDGLTAIQCKFYAADSTVSKSDIDSFISASAVEQFTSRLIFDTSAGWSGNAEQTLVGVAQRIDISYLADAAIDWGQFSWETPQIVVPTSRKALRKHQETALNKVSGGLAVHDRGKLIMACGTGKTFTSLRIAEHLVGVGGSVLFLVPSIQLLSQSLREWTANAAVDIRPFAVCSDVRVGRTTQMSEDDSDILTIDLAEPATTSAPTLLTRINRGKHALERMTVVFATYQSIDVIIQAQEAGLASFDLVICDEAHRTAGFTLAGDPTSAFMKVHDGEALKAAKRLYMTATPKLFAEDARRKADEADAVIADMGDEQIFGPELHRLGFGEAVENDLLTDYKVLVLAVDEDYVAENFQQVMAESGELRLDETAKLLGCWNGLAKNFTPQSSPSSVFEAAQSEITDGDSPVRPSPMRTAVAFARNIKESETAAREFPAVVEQALGDLPDDRAPLYVEARHVDGTMGIQERNAHLAWLKAEPVDDTCRILTNARCLSEGVDVPALDAVLFLTPRGSQVDVVQSVGRVMRKAPGKELGYIILPVVVPSGATPESALDSNERYKVVWQVLQALRAHDDRFEAMINQIELNKKKPSKIEIIPVTTPPEIERPQGGDTSASDGTEPAVEGSEAQGSDEAGTGQSTAEQTMFRFPAEQFRDAMYAKIVAKVGERRYWETWAKGVADIAAAHITRIRGLLSDPSSNAAREFDEFLTGLRGNLNEAITTDQAIEMLAQHLVTRPIFEALFAEYSFTDTNPVAQTMETMLTVLDEHNLESENETLEAFYGAVRRRVTGVDNAEGKQRILIELYDKFFSVAFKKTVDKLGIVYTPIEIVDFILRSTDDVLRHEFGQGLTDEDVHVLDGFTGTGTFVVRLLTSGLIRPEDLARKYANELHANEILLLAYYIAAVNIEATFQDLTNTAESFPGLILTDTFQSWEPDDRPDLNVFPENNQRLERLKALPITAIVGNPPYSSGQDSANDDNANEKYPALDGEIRRTYADRSTATNKNSLYDSYIRALKWASLRIQDRGVIAYVSNGGWLDSNTADGMRLTLAEEFSKIYVYNLRGNQRTAGEQSRREGGKVFGGGSRATVAVTLLVKNPKHSGPAEVHYAEVADYLTTEQKLALVAKAPNVRNLESTKIIPNDHGDWLNQRRDDFETFIPIAEVFTTYSGGLKTNRDAWCYSFSEKALQENMVRLIETYQTDLEQGRTSSTATRNDSLISWNRSLLADLDRGRARTFDEDRMTTSIYRPFMRQHAYFSRELNDMVYRLPSLYPVPAIENFGIYQVGAGSAVPFSVISLDSLPDLHVTGAGSGGQFFARWRYEPVDPDGMLGLDVEGDVIDDFRRIDNITDLALRRFSAAYKGENISKDEIFAYVYGLLHSQEYRATYAADLKRVLPHIPIMATVDDFRAFAEAGSALMNLHMTYESAPRYPLGGLDVLASADDYDFFSVSDKKMRFGGTAKARDRSIIRYNDRITLTGIPEDAHRYMLGSRSAIEWIIDRYYVKTDKASGIVNDPNDWSKQVGDPRYIVDLIARIVTVSVETMKIVDNLPSLEIHSPTAE
ncbi:type ISP restriction/modification enzyme [Kineosporia sp. NBRC 101731]|uniref:DEAD/DEAH box helicase n=1 Tax=Kineosporia sp. NBRC 101731 TaxID=3032199 RepID=UPI00331E5933